MKKVLMFFLLSVSAPTLAFAADGGLVAVDVETNIETPSAAPKALPAVVPVAPQKQPKQK